MLLAQDLLFLISQCNLNLTDFALLELTANMRIGNIMLETTHIVRQNIFLGIFSVTGDRNGFEHPHQIGKWFGTTIMGSGRGENHRVALLCQELCQITTKTAIISYLMAFVNHNYIPMCFFEPSTETTIILQRINRDDGLVVVVERILIKRNLVLNLCHTKTVQTNQGNGKAIPNFLLELSQYAFQRTHQYAFATATANHFSQEDTHFNCLTQT